MFANIRYKFSRLKRIQYAFIASIKEITIRTLASGGGGHVRQWSGWLQVCLTTIQAMTQILTPL